MQTRTATDDRGPRFAELDAILSQKRPALAITAPPAVRRVLEGTAHAHGLTVPQMRQHCAELQYVAARSSAARKLRKLGFSLPQIGRYLGGFHHTTVLNLLKYKEPEPVSRSFGEIPCPDLSGEWAI